jgi:hypothetical protein
MFGSLLTTHWLDVAASAPKRHWRFLTKQMILAIFLIASLSLAQQVVTDAARIVINPIPSFNVEVFVNKNPSGDQTPDYAVGEAISVGVRVSENAYVYLFNVRSNGEVQQLIPNRYDREGQNNYLTAGQTKYFPPSGARYSFNVEGPRGFDKIIAVASKTQLDTRQLADFTSDPSFASSTIGESGFANSFSIVITPVPQNDWVTDTVSYYIREP